MTRYNGSAMVEGGYYWNLNKWSVAAVLGDRGVLEGTSADRYIRMPLPILAPLTLLMGGLFVIFLPLIGFGLTLYAVAKKAAQLVSSAMSEVVVAPTWHPGEAHFTGKGNEKGHEDEEAEPGEELDNLRQLIDAKREAEKETDKNEQ